MSVANIEKIQTDFFIPDLVPCCLVKFTMTSNSFLVGSLAFPKLTITIVNKDSFTSSQSLCFFFPLLPYFVGGRLVQSRVDISASSPVCEKYSGVS